VSVFDPQRPKLFFGISEKYHTPSHEHYKPCLLQPFQQSRLKKIENLLILHEKEETVSLDSPKRQTL